MTSSCETLELGTAATECTLPFAVVDISVDISFYDQYTKHLTARYTLVKKKKNGTFRGEDLGRGGGNSWGVK